MLKQTAENIRFDGATENEPSEADNEVLIECWSRNESIRDVALDSKLGTVESI